MAEGDSGYDGFVPPDDGIVACDTFDGYEVKRISGNQVQTLLSVTSAMSDDNFTLIIRPYKSVDMSQVKMFHEIGDNGLSKKLSVVLSQGAFCCAIEFLENSYKVLYQYWRNCGSSSSKKIFPIDLNSGNGKALVKKDVTDILAPTNYLTLTAPFMTTLQKDKQNEERRCEEQRKKNILSDSSQSKK